MRYMMIVKFAEDSESRRDHEAGKPPTPELMAAMGKLQEKLKGALLDNGGLLPMPKGARIKAGQGKLSVTDGPFIEAKEVIAGYAVLRASSYAEAIKMGEDFMRLHVDVLGPKFEAELEVREMAEGPEHAARNACG